MTMERRYPRFVRDRFFWEWRELYGRCEYEWTGSLTTSPDGDRVTFEWMDREIKHFLRQLQTGEGLQVAGYYAICRKGGRVHAHFLLFGRRSPSRERKTLRDVDPGRWARRWRHIAEIEYVEDQERAVNYLAAQWKKNYTCLPVDYNSRLLREAAQELEHRDPSPPIGSAAEEALYGLQEH